jgi:hypothetical protein
MPCERMRRIRPFRSDAASARRAECDYRRRASRAFDAPLHWSVGLKATPCRLVAVAAVDVASDRDDCNQQRVRRVEQASQELACRPRLPAVVISLHSASGVVKRYPPSRGGGPPADRAPIFIGALGRVDRNDAHQLVPADRRGPPGQAPAVAAVGRAAKLTRRDLRRQVRGDRRGDAREQAFFR